MKTNLGGIECDFQLQHYCPRTRLVHTADNARKQNLKTMTVAILSPVMNFQSPSMVVFATI